MLKVQRKRIKTIVQSVLKTQKPNPVAGLES